MSTASTPFFWLTCDHPGCQVKSGDDGDYAAWSTVEQARDSANDGDWLIGHELGDFCPEHVMYDELTDERRPVVTLSYDEELRWSIGNIVEEGCYRIDWAIRNVLFATRPYARENALLEDLTRQVSVEYSRAFEARLMSVVDRG